MPRVLPPELEVVGLGGTHAFVSESCSQFLYLILKKPGNPTCHMLWSVEFTILIVKSLHFLRYKPPPPTAQASPGEDLTPDYMNILGMIFSMCGLMMRVSIFEYVAVIYVFKCITVMIDNCH
jgi:hypothetical protein